MIRHNFEYQWSSDFQRRLLAALVRQPKQFVSCIEPTYFNHPVDVDIANFVLKAYRTVGTGEVLARGVLLEIVRRSLSQRKDFDETWSQYKERINQIYRSDLDNLDVLEVQARGFYKQCRLRESMILAEKYLTNDQYDAANRVWTKAWQEVTEVQIENVFKWEKLPDFEQILARKDDPKWLIRDFIPAGCIVMISGQPGSLKTWFNMHMAICFSHGVPFLGLETRFVPVVYLDRENPIEVVRNRLQSLTPANPPFTGCRMLKFCCAAIGVIVPNIGDANLVAMAAVTKPVIMFDSFVRFHEADENSVREMACVMTELRTLANHGATPIIQHHNLKSAEKYRGVTDILAGVDVALQLTVEKSGDLLVTCEKHRYRENFKFRLRPQLGKQPPFEMHGDLQSRLKKDETERILDFLRRNPGSTTRRIRESCGGRNENFGELLKQMLDRNLIRARRNKGQGGGIAYSVRETE